MDLYTCDGCLEKIPAAKARFECLHCQSHHLCANCYVVGIFTKDHQRQHVTTMKIQSGMVARQRSLPPPQLPPRPTAPATTPATPTAREIPNAYAQPIARRPISTQPPSTGPASGQRQPEASTTAVPSPSTATTPTTAEPAAATPPTTTEPAAAEPATATPEPAAAEPQSAANDGWQPFFTGSQPTSMAIAFFNAVFTYLDTQRIGLLTPEQYSACCDVQGYGPDEDVWKRNMATPVFGYNREDVADFELRTVYENWSIDHTLHKRDLAPNRDMENVMMPVIGGVVGSAMSKIMKQSMQQRSMSGGMMPMISRKGFIDLMTIEIDGEPSKGWLQLNRIARHYNIWRQWGDVPREMLPEFAPQDLLDRCKRVAEFSQQRAAERLQALEVQMQIQKQGREAALRLVDPPGTTYRYTY